VSLIDVDGYASQGMTLKTGHPRLDVDNRLYNILTQYTVFNYIDGHNTYIEKFASFQIVVCFLAYSVTSRRKVAEEELRKV